MNDKRRALATYLPALLNVDMFVADAWFLLLSATLAPIAFSRKKMVISRAELVFPLYLVENGFAEMIETDLILFSM